ncbi:UDP-N-acetylmuramate--alanine ligase [Loktanella agnita]|uniref:UDP-N-acetylmuramate--alanine ligase n=1 Tax=Loktanella agnita TaxID=287097 RepID=UPI00398846CA
MGGVFVLGAMLTAACVSFVLLLRLMRGGQDGWALTVMAVLGGVFTVLLYASGRPFGIDPVFAMSVALLGVLPAFLGGGAGTFLGWLLRRRDDVRFRGK